MGASQFRYRLYPSRWRRWAYLVACVILLVAAVLVGLDRFTSGDTIGRTFAMPIAVLVAAGFCFSAIKSLLGINPLLELNRDGLVLHPGGRDAVSLNWSEITGVAEYRYEKVPILGVRVVDANEVFARMGWKPRWVESAADRLGSAQFYLVVEDTGVTIQNVIAKIREVGASLGHIVDVYEAEPEGSPWE